MRRVTEIDATGERILADIHTALTRRSQRLALAMAKNSEIAVRLSEAGILEAIGTDRIFEDIDRAIGWAEDNLARVNAQIDEGSEIPFEQVGVFSSQK